LYSNNDPNSIRRWFRKEITTENAAKYYINIEEELITQITEVEQEKNGNR
jgi:hypothetical protein